MAETSRSTVARSSTTWRATTSSLLAAMRRLIPEKLPEWTDFDSEADFGNVLLELFAHMGDILELLPGPGRERELPRHGRGPGAASSTTCA